MVTVMVTLKVTLKVIVIVTNKPPGPQVTVPAPHRKPRAAS